MLENSPEKFDIIFNYGKCRFASICQEFNSKLIYQINSDLILYHYSRRIVEEFKENIIKQIVKSSSSIPIDYLSNLVKENSSFVEKTVVNLIISGNLNCRIDKINKIILSLENSSIHSTYKKGLSFSDKTYFDLVSKLIQ